MVLSIRDEIHTLQFLVFRNYTDISLFTLQINKLRVTLYYHYISHKNL